MRKIDPVPSELWDKVASDCSYATFCHTRIWAEIVSRSYDIWEIATKAFVLNDGAIAILPLMSYKAGM